MPQLFPRARWLGLIPGLLAAVALPAGSVAAQGGAFLSPTIGVYIPSNELLQLVSGAQQTYKLDVALDLGARVGIWFGRVGLVITGDYSPTTLQFDSAGTVRTADATVVAGTGRFMFYLIPKQNLISLMLSGGVSVNAFSPKAYSSKADYSDIGGVVGASLGFHLGRTFGITINADDNIYQASFQPISSPGGTGAPTQHDIRVSAGLRFGG